MNAYELYVKIGADLEGLQSGLDKAKGMASSVMSGIGNVAKVGLGATTAVIAGATTAVGAFGKQALGSYAEYEQLIGGIETLYEDLSVDIVDNAKKAYMTAGKSANEYYQTAISFAGALNKSLEESDGNIARSAEVTDMIITDMSDNVNKMGTDMEMVENAYRGFSRGNFTMLDNLSLGFAGTKEGMQELLDKAQEISGIEYDISSFADIADAIHVVQKDMGIAGTTAKEAMTTIEGTANATKSAWENLKTAVGKGEGIKEAFSGLKDAIFGVGLTEDGKETGLLNQVIPRIQTIMGGVGEAIKEASPMISETIPELIDAVLPAMLDGGIAFAGALVDGIVNTLPSLWSSVESVASTVGDYIFKGVEAGAKATENADFTTPISTALDKIDTLINSDKAQQFITDGCTIVANVAKGIGDSAPDVIPKATEIVTTFANNITENVPTLLEAGGQMAVGLAEGVLKSAPKVWMTFYTIKFKVLGYIAEMALGLVNKGKEGVSNMISTIGSILPQLPTKIAYYAGYAVTQFGIKFLQLVDKAKDTLEKTIKKIIDFGKDMKEKAPQIANDFKDKFFEEIDKIPEKIMEKGKKIGEAFINGIKSILDGAGNIWDSFKQGASDAVNKNKSDGTVTTSAVNTEFIPRNVLNSSAPITDDFGLDNNGSSFDYDSLAQAIVKAFVASDIAVECDGREFGRLVRKAVTA